jgi:hypothetical protein
VSVADEPLVELVMAADELLVAEDGAVATVARNTAGGLEAAFALAVRGGMQPQRVGFEVNPLARRVENAVVLRSVGDPTERFVHAAANAWGQDPPPPRSRWKRLFERGKKPGEARFSGLLVMREGDASAPSLLRLKLFCDGGELYLDIDAQTRRITLYEKDSVYRPALLRALLPLIPD